MQFLKILEQTQPLQQPEFEKTTLGKSTIKNLSRMLLQTQEQFKSIKTDGFAVPQEKKTKNVESTKSLKNKLSKEFKEEQKTLQQIVKLSKTLKPLLPNLPIVQNKTITSENVKKQATNPNSKEIVSESVIKQLPERYQKKVKEHEKKIQKNKKALEDLLNDDFTADLKKKTLIAQKKLKHLIYQNNQLRKFKQETIERYSQCKSDLKKYNKKKKDDNLNSIVLKQKNSQIKQLELQINKTKFSVAQLKNTGESRSNSSLQQRLLSIKMQLKTKTQENNQLEQELISIKKKRHESNYSGLSTSDTDSGSDITFRRRPIIKKKSLLVSENEIYTDRNRLTETDLSTDGESLAIASEYETDFDNEIKPKSNDKIQKSDSNEQIVETESMDNKEQENEDEDEDKEKEDSEDKEKDEEKGEEQGEEKGEEKDQEKQKVEEKEKDYDITSTEILFTIPTAVEYFKEYLCKEMCQENILFFLEVKNYKNSFQNEKKMVLMANQIYKKYVKTGALFEVNIDYKCRDEITKNIKEKNINKQTFDKAQDIVFIHMDHNQFGTFKNTELYQDLLKTLKSQSGSGFDVVTKNATFVSSKSNVIVLNTEFWFSGKSRAPCKVIEELMDSMISIFNGWYSISSSQIEFDMISKSISFNRFHAATTELQRVKLKTLNQKELLSFFINAYNLLMLHSGIINGIPQNQSQLRKFLNESKYNIGGSEFSLNDIFYGILRKNRDIKNNPYFENNDPRAQLTLQMFEPRIHFALFSYDSQSIIVQTFLHDKTDKLLDRITKIQMAKNVKIQKNKIYLPRILRNYTKDFGDTIEKLIIWVTSYLRPSEQKILKSKEQQITVKFLKERALLPIFILDTKSLFAKKYSDYN
ncbi:electron carrier/ protein disulfide oxidoreductase [Anaeramoeba flamelloides]|uniref:Electron carrier/ protein disulfide oxidoreductase n=1 Tax=Anaeramoeba flamelloides TaxID=1746091 RepID=A0AAV7ZTG1_9EUKA|nr:electron carrier/ protein disulfide oxidoreductase [Anaeramoeba flamelloides]